MKKVFKMGVVFALVFSLGFSATTSLNAQTEETKPLLGTWDVELTEMQMLMQFVFKMEEDSLAGTLEFDMGDATMEEITFSENKLTFIVNIDAGGQMMSLEVVATVEGEEMTGTMISEMGDAGFTGKKRKEN